MKIALFLTMLNLARMGALAWAIILALWGILVVLLYPSVAEAPISFEDYLEAFPEALQTAVGATEETASLTFADGNFTLAGFLSMEYISWFALTLGIYAVVYCGGLVSREVERGTLDLLLAQPLKRSTFLLTKYIAFTVILIGVSTASWLGIAISVSFIEGDISLWNLALTHLVGLSLVWAIAAYSTLASCLFLDAGRALALAGSFTALSYFANLLSTVSESLIWVQKLSLFHYFRSMELLVLGQISWLGVLVYLGVTVVCLAAALVVLERRDIKN
jgi:ABC-2 type transport system permease protein